MIVFWLAAALLALGAGGLIVARAARSATSPASEDPALAVHRRALAEIDALAERGLIAPGERRATRAEAGRRLLAAAERSPRAPSTALKSRWLTGAAAGGPLLALALYLAVGSPSAPDRPFAGRLARWLARPELDQPAELAAALSALAAGRPTATEPPRLLAALEL
ncbi:MAG: c-type cytochrome biogenesis protein CcmI, partial [Caulobacteraceae bacterium]